MFRLICLIFAFVCFCLASLNVGGGRINLVAVGLAFFSLAFMLELGTGAIR